MEPTCNKHRYGEPDQQGWVTCSVCNDSFNVADENDTADDYTVYRDGFDAETGQDSVLDQIADFEGECNDRLNTFINSFSFENKCLGYISYHDAITCISSRGMRLYERYRDRLYKVGAHRFPGHELMIESDVLEEIEDED
jgi:hypothetical protein